MDREVYWKNSCEKKWAFVKKPAEHTNWKSYFFSKYMQDYIENIEVGTAEPGSRKQLHRVLRYPQSDEPLLVPAESG